MAAVSQPEAGAVVITTVEKLGALGSGGSYYLTGDLDLAGTDLGTISLSKSVTLDGQGHRITGLSGSLLSIGSGATTVTLRNLQLEGVEEPVVCLGLVAATVPSTCVLTLDNCVVKADLAASGTAPTGQTHRGGLIGSGSGANAASSITNCAFVGTIQADSLTSSSYTHYVGGIAGTFKGRISGCYIQGSVTGRTQVGGIVGWTSGAVTDCYVQAAVSGGSYAGGVAGISKAPVTRCSVVLTGSMTATKNAGGLVGDAEIVAARCTTKGVSATNM